MTIDATQWAVPDRLGVTHAAGRYSLGGDDFLLEGADEILGIGSRVFKGWLDDNPRNVYRFGKPLPPVNSLVELVSTPSYRALFERPFTTYVFEVYQWGSPRHYWLDDPRAVWFAEEERQVEALATHFLTTYAGTGKTFVFQNWEGDWAVRGHTDPEQLPTQQGFDGMLRWMEVRQRAVDRARDRVGADGVNVFNALEVNIVSQALEGRPCVTNDVVPKAGCDLYSYSAWDTTLEPEQFAAALAHLGAMAPPSDAFGDRNVMLGEFGCAENRAGPGVTAALVENVSQTALDWGCPWVVYWQVFDDSCVDGWRDENAVEDCSGFWLIKPSGARGAAYDVLQRKLAGG
ncbi:MAG: hypothetical protein QOK43_2159 [Acidimicrobiaceae bacterium]|nr:hypothetical protein [Acidimicrobiaceae bacterium]